MVRSWVPGTMPSSSAMLPGWTLETRTIEPTAPVDDEGGIDPRSGLPPGLHAPARLRVGRAEESYEARGRKTRRRQDLARSAVAWATARAATVSGGSPSARA